MSVGWGGANPNAFHDAGVDYELGTRYLANQDIIVTHVRVWGTGVSASLANRRGYIRSTGDVILGTAVLPNQMAAGFTEHALGAPVAVAAGTTFWVTYGTLEDYGARAASLPQSSADAAVTANLGGFHPTVGNLPTTTGTTFYGVDITYTVVISTDPVVGVSVTRSGLAVQATLTIDDDTPAGVSYVVEWGDGTLTGVSGLGPHAHTYPAAGSYALMVTATDDDGNTDSAAIVAVVFDPAPNRTGKRAEIAAALATVPDVRGYAYRPATPKAGDAWVLLGALERGPGSVFGTTWRVRVHLPQEERAASVWTDAHMDALYDALKPCAFVDRIEPIMLPVAGAGEMYALEFTMRSE